MCKKTMKMLCGKAAYAAGIALSAVLICLNGACTASAGPIALDPAAPSYHNERFGFDIAWEPGRYEAFEADNGDGITVTDGSGLEMRVYATLAPSVFGLSFEDFLSQHDNPDAAYRRVNREEQWVAVSYDEGGSIRYTKAFYTEDIAYVLDMQYPAALIKHYDQLVKTAVRSFAPAAAKSR